MSFSGFHRQRSLANRITAYVLIAIACFSLFVGGSSFLVVKRLLDRQAHEKLSFDSQKALAAIHQSIGGDLDSFNN